MSLREAVRRASGDLNGEEVVECIKAYNRGAASVDGDCLHLTEEDIDYSGPGCYVVEHDGRLHRVQGEPTDNPATLDAIRALLTAAEEQLNDTQPQDP